MSEKVLTWIEFESNGEMLESIRHADPPHVGENIEVGAKFEDGKRLDAGVIDNYSQWHNAEYKTVLRGTVERVTRHYHRDYQRAECTIHVELSNIEQPNE